MHEWITIKEATRITGTTTTYLYDRQKKYGIEVRDGVLRILRTTAGAIFEARVANIVTADTTPQAEHMCRLRLRRGWSLDDLARSVGCAASTLRHLETGYTQRSKYLDAALEALESDVQPGDNDPVGTCTGCALLLFADEAHVPATWVTHWHVDCGELCPACALVRGEGDVERAADIVARTAGACADFPASDFRQMMQHLEAYREHAVG